MAKKIRQKPRFPLKALLSLVLVGGIIAVLFSSVSKNANKTLRVPQFSSGKIAFVYKDTIWVANKNGSAKAVTKESINHESNEINYNVTYAHPQWSPESKWLAFKQYITYGENWNQGPKSETRIAFYDGYKISRQKFIIEARLPLYWIAANHLIYPMPFANHDSNGKLTLDVTSSKLIGDKQNEYYGDEDMDYRNSQPSDTFVEYANLLAFDSCGGGGGPAWKGVLRDNQHGRGNRPTLVYLPNTKQLIYSSGCENEQVNLVVRNDNKSKPFGQLEQRKLNKYNSFLTPLELVLSPDQKVLAGIFEENIALYNPDGTLIKFLTNEAHAYGPVFSPDSTKIYYADNAKGDIPSLKSVTIESGTIDTIYTSPRMGGISNITVSPDGKQILFTRIDQTIPKNNDTALYEVDAKQSLYLTDLETKKTQLFLKDAYQGDWGE